MAQYLKIETIGSIGSIILAILEVQVDSKKFQYGLGTIYSGFPSLGLGVGLARGRGCRPPGEPAAHNSGLL